MSAKSKTVCATRDEYYLLTIAVSRFRLLAHLASEYYADSSANACRVIAHSESNAAVNPEGVAEAMKKNPGRHRYQAVVRLRIVLRKDFGV